MGVVESSPRDALCFSAYFLQAEKWRALRELSAAESKLPSGGSGRSPQVQFSRWQWLGGAPGPLPTPTPQAKGGGVVHELQVGASTHTWLVWHLDHRWGKGRARINFRHGGESV